MSWKALVTTGSIAIALTFCLPACTTIGGHQPDPGEADAGDDPDPRIDAGPNDPDADPDDPDPPDPDIDAGDPDPPDENCGAWSTGTLTGYNNSDLGDDPNAGSVVEFTGLTDAFYNEVNMAAIDQSDWGDEAYHYIDVKWNGKIGRIAVWDMCRNADCPDGTDCCTENKELFAHPGYLVDVEQRTAKRLFGVDDAENTLQDQIQYRICGDFDPDMIAEQYGAYRW
jgi:hypothetical protein